MCYHRPGAVLATRKDFGSTRCGSTCLSVSFTERCRRSVATRFLLGAATAMTGVPAVKVARQLAELCRRPQW
jgi:hypothetical protein